MASLDKDLITDIEVSGSPLAFLTLLIDKLSNYGRLEDGRDPIEVLLKAIIHTEGVLGIDDKATLENLILEWNKIPPHEKTSLTNINLYLNYLVSLWENAKSPLLPLHLSFFQVAVPIKMIAIDTISGKKTSPNITELKSSTEAVSHTSSFELPYFLDTMPETKRWSVIGDPGTGKTTLLLATAFKLAKRALADTQSPIPLLVSLATFGIELEKDFGRSIFDHIDSIGKKLGFSNFGNKVQGLVQEGRVIFLFDGLDEISDNINESIIKFIDIAIPLNSENRVIYTSRKIGFSAPSNSRTLEIQPLEVEQQRKLMLDICGEEKTRMLLRNIAGRPNLREMAGVPITLTVLALVASESKDDFIGYLQRQADLFKYATRILLEGKHKGGKGVANPEKAEKILARASFYLHKQVTPDKNGEIFSERDIEKAISLSKKEWLAEWKGHRDFLNDVAKSSNIIYSVDVLQRNYRYIHRTFREFYAAFELSMLDNNKRHRFIKKYVHNQKWAEVFVLLGGLVDDGQDYLYQLLDGPEDLALRTLKEVKDLTPKLALEVLKLKSPNQRERREVFSRLVQKLDTPVQIIDTLHAYLDTMKHNIPRADLYFIQEILLKYSNLDISKDILKNFFLYLPAVPDNLFQSVCSEGKTYTYWCKVNAGSFLMGAEENDSDKPPWVPTTTEIYLSEFEIARIPVTNKLYEVFDPLRKGIRSFSDIISTEQLDNHPVVDVSWYETSLFCQWLAQKYPGIRLPSEAEWEKAASWTYDGKKLKFPWGNKWNPTLLNSWQEGPNHTTPVASYPKGASPCGAFDMAGNVWEWCFDWFSDEEPCKFSQKKDPKGPETGIRKIDRGGGWYHDVGVPCTFLRAADDPTDVFAHCGFRLVKRVE